MLNKLSLAMAIFLSLNVSVYAGASDRKTSLTQQLLNPVIDLKCRQELKASKVWQAAAYFMSEQHKAAAQTEICSCVSENALNDMTATDLLKASVSEEAKNRLITAAVLNSLSGCAKQAFK